MGSGDAPPAPSAINDLNSFCVRADPITETPSLEPGMTVWLDRGPTN
jgi:hypothetical protein